uniref:Cytochrome P450 734A1 n=3 Tax=Zea mays TaxID=4577 RepID=A0A804P3A1_MAIZE
MDAAGAGWLSWRAAAVAVLAWLALHVAARVADALWWRPRRLEAHFAAQGVRGPPYRFLLGSVKEMVGLMAEASSKPMSPPTSHNALPRVLAFYHYWRKIYGPNFLIWFGPTPRLTVAEPELVREIFLTRAEAFDRYEAHPVVRQLEGDGLVSLHGDKWALHRRVLADAFYPDNLKRLVPHVGRSVAALAEKWRAMASASSSGEVEVDVAEWFQAVTEEAITRATFGRSYDDGRVVFAMQGRLMAYASEAFRKVLVPGYRFLPTKKNWQSWKLDREIRRSLTRLIARRSDEAEAEEEEMGSHSGGFRDLLGAMINAGERKTPPAGAIPVADMLEECKTFFFAGKQTTTNLLAWATVLLAMHPEWQERARREVLDVLGPDELPSKEHLPRLKTVSGHDHKRDPAAVPAGGGHHPARQDGRAALQRVPDPARHGAADPDHGDPPRRQALGRRRGAVQPRAVRRRRGEGGEAPAGVHPVRAWRPGVHRPEPGAPGGPAHRGGPASAVRDQGVPELRPRAHGPDAPLPAVRRAGDLPATTSRAPGSRIIAQILRLSGCPTFFLSKLTGMPRVCHLPPGSGGPVQNDRNTPPATLCPCVY